MDWDYILGFKFNLTFLSNGVWGACSFYASVNRFSHADRCDVNAVYLHSSVLFVGVMYSDLCLSLASLSQL